ncbi:hypothetical protein ACEWY4_001793 [Coilia grayii]|uniref:Proline and serine-rich protein 2 n=1 Tax=Coilia grayii TaxID=363190 RepID=A0ABD1KTY1_9TELE
MPSQRCAPELLAMDVQVQPSLHCRVNGGHNSSVGTRAQSFDDDALQHLSLAEKECILFFEETIDSLEDGFQDELEEEGEGPPQVQEAGLSSGSNTPVEVASVPQSPVQTSTPVPEHPHSPRENDIIDLVYSPPPDHSGVREVVFQPTMPDFQSLAVAPETHFEMNAKRHPLENFPSEYHLSPPSMASTHGQDAAGGGYQPPVGSVPTPVVIAQKLAENQGDSMLPSMLVKRRRSLESTRVVTPTSQLVAEQSAKQGPPTSSKPNVNLMLGTRDLNHSVAVAAVNAAQERRALLLANLSGAPHPMEGGEPPCRRNLPTRSVSFRDSTPEKSHMEALSKLGLVRSRARSITPTVEARAEPKPKPRSPTITTTSFSSLSSSSSSSSSSIPSPTLKAEIHTDFNRFGGKSTVVTPLPAASPTVDTPPASVAPASADVVSRDFNSYGGKTITVVPAATSTTTTSSADPSPSPPPPSARTTPPPAKTDAPAFEINSYGGRTKTIIPASALARADVTDGPAGHQQDARVNARTHTPSPPSTIKGEVPHTSTPAAHITPTANPATSNSVGHYGCRSKVITPAPAAVPKVDSHPPEAPTSASENRARTEVLVSRGNSFGNRPSATARGGCARGKSATLPPTAPKPANPHRVTKLPSPEHEVRRKPAKPSFRSQGVTVQFSGRGATDESRREALRKLGLLKDTKDTSLL